MRIKWTTGKPQTISIVAELKNGRLDAFETSRGGKILLVQAGEYTSTEMFQQADRANTRLTWTLRFAGFILMFLSIMTILQPISTALDIIPVIGDWIGEGLEKFVFPCIACTISVPISLFMISLAWLVYRPKMAILMCVTLVTVVGCFVVGVRRLKTLENNGDDSVGHEDQGNSALSSEEGKETPYEGTSLYHSGSDQEYGANTDDLPPSSPPDLEDEPEIRVPVDAPSRQ